MDNDELDRKWPVKPDCTRDRLLYLLDVFSEEPDSTVVSKRLDEAALTLGDLRILADVAVRGEYALDGETGSEIEVGDE
ncbi:hypothetical protein SEA_KELA_30 [Streptomyces phage Kela]|nr:hypothetical protein SEA_KELA_30 [Streptomyces phage Kela]